MLLVASVYISRGSTRRSTVLITKSGILRRGRVMMAGSVTFGASCHVRCLGRAPLDFIGRKFFQVSYARL